MNRSRIIFRIALLIAGACFCIFIIKWALTINEPNPASLGISETQSKLRRWGLFVNVHSVSYVNLDDNIYIVTGNLYEEPVQLIESKTSEKGSGIRELSGALFRDEFGAAGILRTQKVKSDVSIIGIVVSSGYVDKRTMDRFDSAWSKACSSLRRD